MYVVLTRKQQISAGAWLKRSPLTPGDVELWCDEHGATASSA